MVSWYDPRLLARIGVRTIISSVFGQYADQRLMQAVTDPAEDKELVARYDFRDPECRAIRTSASPVDETGAYLDRLRRRRGRRLRADLHHGLPAGAGQPRRARCRPLPHGEILIMGGDQCYPQATREEYKKRLLLPFSWAFTVAEPDRKLFAIPGNHDWYDGLDRLRQPVLLRARQALQRQGQHHRRLAMPAASQLLGAAPAAQLVDLGRRHPVLEVPRLRAGELLRGRRRADGAAGQPDHLPRRAVLAAGRPAGPGRGGELLQDHGHRPLARRARRRRDRRRLAQLQPLLRPRARRALHHVGRRRRLPASHARAAQLRSRCAGRSARSERGGAGPQTTNPRQGEA